MAVATLLSDGRVEKIINAHRLSTKEIERSLEEKVPIKFPSKATSNTNLNIFVAPINNTFYLEIDSQILAKYPLVCFIDNEGKIIAQLEFRSGKCEFVVLEQQYIVDVHCMFEGDAFSLQSLGEIHLSGSLKTNERIQVDCNSCVVQDVESEDENGNIYHDYSFIQSPQAIIRSKEGIVLDKRVHLEVEQLYCSAKNTYNKASFQGKELILVAEKFVNEGKLTVSKDMTGFTLEFYNKNIIDVKNLFTLATHYYLDKGQTETDIFNLQTRKADLYGLLKVHKELKILSNEEVCFYPQAILESQGDFEVRCDGNLSFAGALSYTKRNETENVNQKLQFFSDKALDIKGYIAIENSEAIFIGNEKLRMSAMISADKQSDVYFQSKNVDIEERVFHFRVIYIQATKKIKVNKPLMAYESIFFKAEFINLKEVLESEKIVNLLSRNITISDNGKVLTKQHAEIECDTLHNNGDIVSENSIHCGVNYFTCNQGSIVAKQIGIDTAFYVHLGSLYGIHLLTVNSFVSVSAGIIYAGQYRNTSLLNLDIGAYIAQLPELKDLFVNHNLTACIKLISKNLAPQITQSLILAQTAYQWLWPVFKNPYKTCEHLLNICSEKFAQLEELTATLQTSGLPKLPLHRLIASIVQLKGTKNTLEQISSLQNFSENIKKEISDLKVLFNEQGLQKLIQAIDPIVIGKNLATELLPGYSSLSLMHISAGTAITAHSDLRSTHMHNLSFHAGLASLSIEAKNLTNIGGWGAIGEISLKGEHFKNEGLIFSPNFVQVNFKNVEVASPPAMPLYFWQVRADTVTLFGEQHFQTSAIKTKEFTCEEDSILSLKHSSLEAEKKFEQMLGSEFFAEDAVLSSSDIDFNSKAVLIRSSVVAENEIRQRGDLTGEQAILESEKIDLNNVNLNDGQIKAKSDLTIKNAKTIGTALGGKKVKLSDSVFKGRNHDLETEKKTTEDTTYVASKEKVSETLSNIIEAKEHLYTERVIFEGIQVNAEAMDAEKTSVKKSTINVNGTLHAKDFKTEKSWIKAGKAEIEGKTQTDEVSAVLGKLETKGKFKGYVRDETGEIIGKLNDNSRYGMLVYANDGQLLGKVDANAEVRSASVMESETDFDLGGQVEGSNTSFAAKNIKFDAAIKGKEKFDIYAENKIIINKETQLNMESLAMKAHVFEHSGKITTTHGYSLEAERVYNWWSGEFDVRGGSTFDVKQVLMNAGKMNGDSMQINAGVYANLLGWVHTDNININAAVYANIGGDIAGYDSLSVNAGLALNAGLMRSMHTRSTALASFNLGLYVPALPSSWSQLLSWDTAFNVGKTLLYNVSPTMGSVVGTAKGAYHLAVSGKAIYNSICKVGTQAIRDPKSINIGEVVGLLVGAKDLVDSATDTYTNHASEELTVEENQKHLSVTGDSIKSTACQAATLYATERLTPTISYDTIYHRNAGGMYSGNISERSVWANNSGQQWVLGQYNSTTMFKENNGLIDADNINLKSNYFIENKHFINRGVMKARTSFEAEIKEMDNYGVMKSPAFKMAGDQFKNYGLMRTGVADIEIKDWKHIAGKTQIGGGNIVVENLNIQQGSQVDLKQTELTIDNALVVDDKSQTSFKEVALCAKNADIHGQAVIEQSYLKAKDEIVFHEGAHVRMKNSTTEGSVIQGNSQFEVEGNNVFHAHRHIDTAESSAISGPGIVGFKGPEGTFRGKLNSRGVIFDIEKLDDLQALTYGEKNYQHFQPTEFLSIQTPDTVCLNHTLKRECKLELTANKIEVNAPLFLPKGFNFKTTQSNVEINADIYASASSAIVSAKHIVNNEAKVVSTEQLYLNTSNGNLNNFGGLFQGQRYLHAEIQGDVNNVAVMKQLPRQYGPVTHYEAACLLGGGGSEHKVGLYIQADGKFINDASRINSEGDNIIFAKEGYEGLAHTCSYISERYKKNGWFNGKESEVKKMDVFISCMTSTQGQNVVISNQGSIISDASSFIAKNGTDLFALDDINLRGVRGAHEIKENSYSWFGLWGSNKQESHEKITPTIIFDVGRSNIRSHKGNIDALDACFMGPGYLSLNAKNVKVASSVENHTIDGHTRSLSLDAFSFSAIQAIATGQDFLSPILHQDPTLDKLNNLWKSNSGTELAANGWNTALNIYNTYQTFDAAYKLDHIGATVLQRYGLGDNSGFNPNVSITYQNAAMSHNYQTLGLGGIQRGSLEVKAENKFSVVGAAIDIAGDMLIRAKVFEQQGIALEDNFFARSNTISLGVAPKGGIVNIGIEHQSHDEKQINQQLQKLYVGNKLYLEVDEWSVDQATTDVGGVSGHVGKLSMISRQNIYSNDDVSMHLSTAGTVGYSVANDQSTKLYDQSRISVRNKGDSGLVIDSVNLTGSEIQTVDNLSIQIDKIDSQPIDEKTKGYRYGVAANVYDLLPSRKKETKVEVESTKTLPTVNIQYNDHIFHAMNQPMISTDDMNIANKLSKKTVLIDQNVNFQIDVPVILLPEKKIEKPQFSSQNELIENENLLKSSFFPVPLTDQDSYEINVTSKNDEVFYDKFSKSQGDSIHGNNQKKVLLTASPEKDKTESFIEKSSPISWQVEDTGVSFETHDIRIGKKGGSKGKKKLYDIDDGKYTNKKNALKKISEKNKKDKINKTSKENSKENLIKLKISSESELFNPAYFCLQLPYGYMDENHVILPTLIGTYYGNVSAEWNLSNYQGSTQLDLGGSLRANLASGQYDIGLSQIKYVVDAASIYGATHLCASTERGANLELGMDFGVMGPNACIGASSPEVCVFGLTFQTDVSLKGGVGTKAALGCGATLDKMQPKIRGYAKFGLFSGVGGEIECKGHVGIDTEAYERFSKECDKIVNEPIYKDALEGLRKDIIELEKEKPTTWWGSFWNSYKLVCLRETEDEILESIGEMAGVTLLFDVRRSNP